MHRAEDLSRFTERAFWTATSGRPGAVLLNVPMDMFSRPVPDELAARYPLPAETGRPALEPETAARIAELLIAAERPLIYLGGGLRVGRARKALLTLAEHLDIPMAHSLMAKGTVPDNHPLLLGMPGFWGLEVTNDYARNADLVLALGTRFAETDASSWDPAYTWRFPPSRLIQIDIDPAEIGRNYPVEIGAVADTALAVTAIADAVTSIRSVPVSRDGLRATITAARGAAFAAAREQGQGASSRCGRSGSWPTCGRRCPRTRCWSPTSAGTRTASRSATNCPPRAGSSPPAGRRPWASAPPPPSGCRSAIPNGWWWPWSATAA